jgi:hypothetical protein
VGGSTLWRGAMWKPEAVLILRRDAFGCSKGSEEFVTVGGTSSAALVRAIGGELIAQAERQAEMWRGLDETLGDMAEAEVDRLRAVLRVVVREPQGSREAVPH